jgi:hypothetical protein
MFDIIVLYVGAGVITLWGVAHLIPSRSIVRGFGDISRDNRLIITMGWIAEGLALIFIGVLVFLVTYVAGPVNLGARIVYRLCFCMLVVMAVLSFFTGARTSVIPMKVCPFVKLLVAASLVPSMV